MGESKQLWAVFHDGKQEVGMELLNIKFGFFPVSCPHNGFSVFMDFKHVFFRDGLRESKNTLEDKGHVAHEIHRVVEDNDIPWPVDFQKRLGLSLRNFFCLGIHRIIRKERTRHILIL